MIEGGRGREGVVLCDGGWSSMVGFASLALLSMGGWWLFMMGDCCSWVGDGHLRWGMVVCGGVWLFVVEGGCGGGL